MSTKTEGRHTGEFLISELPGTGSRDKVTVTVPANTTWEAGLVLGKITATSKYVEYDNGNADGTESADGILYETLVNDTDAGVDVEATIINKDAEVREADLEWKSDQSAGDITAGLADLLALGIKAR